MRWTIRLVFAALLALASSAGAIPPPWVPLGPFGGSIRSLTTGADPATLYAVTSGGVFKTADRGLSWTAINLRGDVTSLAADPVHAGVLYLSVQGEGVIKSTDGGAHWAPANGGLAVQSVAPRAVAVDPARPERLYLLTASAGLWRSGDGGASWRSGGPAGPRSIAVSPAAGTAFLSANGGVYRTLDTGATWKPAGRGLPAGPADALAVAASDPRTVYAYYNGAGLFRSQDGGASWHRQRAAFDAGALVAFAVSPHTPRLLYVSLSNGGFYRSLDGGVLWTGLAGISGVKVIAGAEPRTSGTVYAGLGTGRAGVDLGGVWRSADAGTTWTPRTQGMFAIPVATVAADPNDARKLWTSVDATPYRSLDHGAQWKPRRSIPTADDAGHDGVYVNFIRKLAVGAQSLLGPQSLSWLYALDGRALAATGAFDSSLLFRSYDDAVFWQLLASPVPSTPPSAEMLAIAPSRLSQLYVVAVDRTGLTSQKVYRSTDSGNTWQQEGDPGLVCGLGDLVVAPTSPEVLYAGGSGKSPAPYLCHPPFSPRVARSDDGGTTWTDISAGLPGEFVAALAVDPRDARIVYAGIGAGVAFPAGDGVWKSTDGGQTWSRAGAELAGHTVSALLASTLPGRLYAVVDGNRVFRSDDGGASWQGWTRGLRAQGITALTADPGDPRRIYAATTNGVWALTEAD